MADVPQQVTLSPLTEFENHSILKPSDDNTTALDTLRDRVAACNPEDLAVTPAMPLEQRRWHPLTVL